MNSFLSISLQPIGTLEFHTSDSPGRDCWTLGCETLDRDFADFREYSKYIPGLAVGTLRFQAGWAKTEKQKGVYDFSWLDELVDEALAMKMNVILETDYGNPIYEGGATIDIGGGIPFGEGRAAYFKWVEKLVSHFRGRVRDYAMWNEPDTARQNHTDEEIVELNIETAQHILQVLPEARIAALSIADFSNTRRFESYIRLFAERKALELFQWYIFHAYKLNPDDIGDIYRKLLEVMKKYQVPGKLRQGESGCPSEETFKFAMRGYPWTELSQCKWDLRHYVTDHAFGFNSSIFTICDFSHIKTLENGPGGEINRKGLLMAEAAHKVIRPKQAYTAIRCMTTLLTSNAMPVYGKAGVVGPEVGVCYSWDCGQEGKRIAYWDRTTYPGNCTDTKPCQLMAHDFEIREPVLVDMVTGRVYSIPAESVEHLGALQVFRELPCCDSPLMIVEKSSVRLSK